MSEEISQVASEIQARIARLEELMGDDLKNEMAALKQALRDNPNACLLLREEDVGMLVANLRRILNVAVASAAKEKEKKPVKAKAVQLTPEQLAAALDDM